MDINFFRADPVVVILPGFTLIVISSTSSSCSVENSTNSLFHIFSLVYIGTLECRGIAADTNPDLAASTFAVKED